ncbi:TBC1 domain family member 14-like [Neocloeon triangulifer]|uniref:TBC1 domain family member 14-like n=1 Tax=Neocloeon triangulifer TaxID=2078957 RepID=UPI00286F668C|nr:TBC1 domain family member 14-like [Neocloeon triangulifer]
MFKLRSRSRSKVVVGKGDADGDVAPADDEEDEDLGLVMNIKIDQVEDESSSLVFKKTHRRQNSRSLPKIDVTELLASEGRPKSTEESGKEEWFHTWPENKKEPLGQGVTTNGGHRTAIPLEQLLQAMPLAYSPVTRQLHVIPKVEPKVEEPPPVEDELPKSDCPSKSGSPFSSLSNISRVTLDSLVINPSCPSLDDDASSTASLRDAFLTGQQRRSSVGSTDPSKNKQNGAFSNLFSKSIFGWKSSSKDSGNWRLFGRKSHSGGSEAQTLDEACSSSGSASSLVFTGREASSGSLILEARPSHLPAKSPEEEERHRLQYQQILEAAKKKEMKEEKLKKKQMQQQLKAEDHMANAVRMWGSEVLPKWDSMKNLKKVRDLWWLGIPPCTRGKVWRLAVGNELNLTPDLYEICVSRAQERLEKVKSCSNLSQDGSLDSTSSDKEASVQLIQLDIARTFPSLCIFQRGGPYYDVLHSLLGAYVCYRPDVGYVQGMSFIAAVLILNLEPADAFVCFANMLNRPCQRAFFCLDEAAIAAYFATYNDLLAENLPHLSRHFTQQALTPDLYLLDWMYTMFSRSMPLDLTCRVWDLYLRDGEEFLFRAALGVLHLYQDTLKEMDFVRGSQFLNKLPDDINGEALFRSIEVIRTSVGKLKFDCVLANHIGTN